MPSDKQESPAYDAAPDAVVPNADTLVRAVGGTPDRLLENPWSRLNPWEIMADVGTYGEYTLIETTDSLTNPHCRLLFLGVPQPRGKVAWPSSPDKTSGDFGSRPPDLLVDELERALKAGIFGTDPTDETGSFKVVWDGAYLFTKVWNSTDDTAAWKSSFRSEQPNPFEDVL